MCFKVRLQQGFCTPVGGDERRGRNAGSGRGDGERYTVFLRRLFFSKHMARRLVCVGSTLNNEFIMRATLWTFCNATLVPRGRTCLVFFFFLADYTIQWGKY